MQSHVFAWFCGMLYDMRYAENMSEILTIKLTDVAKIQVNGLIWILEESHGPIWF